MSPKDNLCHLHYYTPARMLAANTITFSLISRTTLGKVLDVNNALASGFAVKVPSGK